MLLGEKLNDFHRKVNDNNSHIYEQWSCNELIAKMEEKKLPLDFITAVEKHQLDGECVFTFSKDEWKETVPEHIANE